MVREDESPLERPQPLRIYAQISGKASWSNNVIRFSGVPLRSSLFFLRLTLGHNLFMPGGPLPVGIAAFTAVKFSGYTVAAIQLKKSYQRESPNPLLIGGARTALGIGVGVAYASASAALVSLLGYGSWPLFLLGLVPVRLAEWFFIILVFFEHPIKNSARAFKLSAVGMAWSFLLDVPALLALFYIPGGFWIC